MLPIKYRNNILSLKKKLFKHSKSLRSLIFLERTVKEKTPKTRLKYGYFDKVNLEGIARIAHSEIIIAIISQVII